MKTNKYIIKGYDFRSKPGEMYRETTSLQQALVHVLKMMQYKHIIDTIDVIPPFNKASFSFWLENKKWNMEK